jgi:hypothetical protein
MSDTGLIGGYVIVKAVTVGTMTSGRPLYRIGSSTWKSLNYVALQVWRAYSSIGSNYTYFKLDNPLDSNQIHMRVDNIRGDFPNWETQAVRGYLSGVQVPASFKDPVNGATNTGNNINGGSTTSSLVQSAMRVFFHGPVDSIVVQQVSLSDWIIAELMIQCELLLPVPLNAWTAENKPSSVLLNWKMAMPPKQVAYFDIEHALDMRNFTSIGRVIAEPNVLTYQFEDLHPAEGKNYYRLKAVDKDGHEEYSNIIYTDRKKYSRPLISVYPNPATSYFLIQTTKRSAVTIYAMDGRMMKTMPAFLGSMQVNSFSWPRGEYIVRTESGDEILICKFLLR